MSPKKVREFFVRLAAANPDPKGELEYSTPYQLLVAVVRRLPHFGRGINLRGDAENAVPLPFGVDSQRAHGANTSSIA